MKTQGTRFGDDVTGGEVRMIRTSPPALRRPGFPRDVEIVRDDRPEAGKASRVPTRREAGASLPYFYLIPLCLNGGESGSFVSAAQAPRFRQA